MYIEKFPSGPLGTNAILIACTKTKRAAVIDPAMGSARKIIVRAKEKGFVIEKILLTHSHWDHFVDAHKVKEETKALLFVHERDRKNVEEPGSDGLPLYVQLHRVDVDQEIADGDCIEVGMLKLQVIHTPGHCPGAVCFYIEEEGVLFSGDTLFRGSHGTLSLPTAEPEKMRGSLEKLSKLPKETRVIPGHGEETTIEEEL